MAADSSRHPQGWTHFDECVPVLFGPSACRSGVVHRVVGSRSPLRSRLQCSARSSAAVAAVGLTLSALTAYRWSVGLSARRLPAACPHAGHLDRPCRCGRYADSAMTGDRGFVDMSLVSLSTIVVDGRCCRTDQHAAWRLAPTQHGLIARQPKIWELALREQAYVPAEQPPSCQDPRVPPAHAHPRRPRHSRRSSAQGPHAAGCLTRTEPSARVALRRIGCVALLTFGAPCARAARHCAHARRPRRCRAPERRPGGICRQPGGRRRSRPQSRETATPARRCARSSRPSPTRFVGLVVRATPAAAGARFSDLSSDLTETLSRRAACRDGRCLRPTSPRGRCLREVAPDPRALRLIGA